MGIVVGFRLIECSILFFCNGPSLFFFVVVGHCSSVCDRGECPPLTLLLRCLCCPCRLPWSSSAVSSARLVWSGLVCPSDSTRLDSTASARQVQLALALACCHDQHAADGQTCAPHARPCADRQTPARLSRQTDPFAVRCRADAIRRVVRLAAHAATGRRSSTRRKGIEGGLAQAVDGSQLTWAGRSIVATLLCRRAARQSTQAPCALTQLARIQITTITIHGAHKSSRPQSACSTALCSALISHDVRQRRRFAVRHAASAAWRSDTEQSRKTTRC